MRFCFYPLFYFLNFYRQVDEAVDEDEDDEEEETTKSPTVTPDITVRILPLKKFREHDIPRFCLYVRNLIQKEGLIPFDKRCDYFHLLHLFKNLTEKFYSAIREIVDSMVFRGDRIEIDIREVALRRLLISSESFAISEGSEVVSGHHVKKIEEEFKTLDDSSHQSEIIDVIEGRISIATSGTMVGQNNALATKGRFGFPCKSTSTVSPGKLGVVNVHKESDLAGGVLKSTLPIITGYIK